MAKSLIVDRIAKAICVASGGTEAHCDTAFGPSRTMYLAMATAAINAMRDPSDAMLEAAMPTLCRYIEDSLNFSDRACAIGVWRAMINEIQRAT